MSVADGGCVIVEIPAIGLEGLPEVLSVFPLSGSLLLPRRTISVEVTGHSHTRLVFDALVDSRMLGVIQSRHSMLVGEPDTYAVGCGGRITSFREVNRDRLMVGLTGICRFAVRGEIDSDRGYRQISADWLRFSSDMSPNMAPLLLDVGRLEDRVKDFCAAHSLAMQSSDFHDIPPDELVDLLVTQLPLGKEEKQALLESATCIERLSLLETFLELEGRRHGGGFAERIH